MAMAKTLFGYSAITAKCRAKSSKLLTLDDYKTLSGMKSLSEVAVFLSERGVYSEELSGASLSGISRRRLEELLNASLNRICNELLCFADGELKKILRGITEKYEIQSIIGKAREIAHGTLADNAIEELKKSLKGTEYFKAVSDCITDGKLDYIHLEVVLLSMHYSKMLTLAKGFGDKNVTDTIKRTIDFRNVDVIIRARHSFGIGNEAVYPYLLGVEGNISKKELMRLCAVSKEEMLSYLSKSLGIEIDAGNYYTSSERNKKLYEYYRKAFSSASPSFGAVFAFIGLCEIEVVNLIHVTEGIRYMLPPERILDCVACTEQ